METDVRKSLDEGEMSRFQWLAVAICVMLIMLDGFDVLVMAFTAPALSAEWKLNGAQLGVLFSAGLLAEEIQTHDVCSSTEITNGDSSPGERLTKSMSDFALEMKPPC